MEGLRAVGRRLERAVQGLLAIDIPPQRPVQVGLIHERGNEPRIDRERG